jgi:hypothetical protein
MKIKVTIIIDLADYGESGPVDIERVEHMLGDIAGSNDGSELLANADWEVIEP